MLRIGLGRICRSVFQTVSGCFRRALALVLSAFFCEVARYHRAMTKVLIIDDDRKHNELLQAYFKRFGINLITALESESGMRKLNRRFAGASER